MTDNTTLTARADAPLIPDDTADRISLSRDRLVSQIGLALIAIETVHPLLAETHPLKAAKLAEAHQHIKNAEQSGLTAVKLALFLEPVARDMSTTAMELATEQDQLAFAIRNRDELESLLGLGQMITEVKVAADAEATQREADIIFDNLASTGVATGGELDDFLMNGHETHYDREQYLAMAEQCYDLYEHFVREAENATS